MLDGNQLYSMTGYGLTLMLKCFGVTICIVLIYHSILSPALLPLKNLYRKYLKKKPKQEPYSSYDKSEPAAKERAESLQATIDVKSKEFDENVVKPKQEEARKKAEDKFYKSQLLGQVPFRGDGTVLDQSASGTTDSSVRRRIPPSVERQEEQLKEERRRLEDEEANRPKPPKLPELCDEPDPGEGVITLAFRTIAPCRLVKRRFYITQTFAIIYSFMRQIGYTHQVYLLVQSYPRLELDMPWETTLQEVGLIQDNVLNIECRETVE